MPILTGPIGRLGPMINVKVMLTHQRVAALKKANLPFTPPRIVMALVDTGAGCSGLDHQLIASLGLEFRGLTRIHTPSTGAAYEIRNLYEAWCPSGKAA